MDLSNFQLADTINDIDMLRNLSEDQEEYNQKQMDSNFELQGNIDLLFQQNTNPSSHLNSYIAGYNNTSPATRSYQKQPISTVSPSYPPVSNSMSHNEYFDKEDILTPLISPAMTPSFGYSIQQKNHSSGLGNDVDFSPLSSPAILPHRDRTTAHRIAYPSSSNVKDISENQIREEYEQLEQAKLLITKKLSELQKKQTQTNDRSETFTMASNYLSMSESSRSMDQNGSSNYMNIDYNSFQNVNNNPAKPSQSNYANTLEPATPASLMNMKPSNNRQQRFSTQVKQNTTNHSFSSPSIKDHHPVLQNGVISPLMTPNTTVLQAPLPPTLSLAKSSGKHSRTATKNEKIKGKSTKKPRRESHIESKTIHASPRALKPLLISPTLQPGPSTTATKSVHSFEDAEKILATKSNYQNLMEGKAAALGIAFSTQIKSGLEVRRTAHKAAEQKRRDSLKEWFDRLRKEVEDGYVKRQSSLMSQVIKAQRLEDEEEGIDSMKPLSKVLLLQYAYEYISSLKETLSEKDSIIDEYKKKTS